MFLHLEAGGPQQCRKAARRTLRRFTRSQRDVRDSAPQEIIDEDAVACRSPISQPAMATRYHTKNGRTSRRGAFLNGIWHCDCDPRLPAEKFQTKNGGKNHGRWFYTCQNPQHKRCGFFLWADDARTREESAVLNNSRTEPNAPPQTPRKQQQSISQTLTPDTRSKPAPPNFQSRLESQNSGSKDSNTTIDETFDWSSSDDEDLASTLDTFETPRKAPRTGILTSPGKHGRDHEGTNSDDVFVTPSTSRKATIQGSGLLSPAITPSKAQATTAHGTNPDSLSSQVLSLFQSHNITLPNPTMTELTSLLSTFELQKAGIVKGRDMSRLALQSKDKKIAGLQAQIVSLEQEKETMRTVIGCMKSDMAQGTSPKKRRQDIGTRSEV